MKTQSARRIVGMLIALLAAGCAATKPAHGDRHAPATAELCPGVTGQLFVGRGVELVSAVDDSAVNASVLAVLEQSLDAYRKLIPDHPWTDTPIRAYLLFSLADWDRFIVARTGADASIYLQVRRGGFSRDGYVALRYLGGQNTLGLAAHEGLHAFVATQFSRPPAAFVEEGLAATFETVRLDDAGRATIDRSKNVTRLDRLRSAIRNGKLRQLGELLAGDASAVAGSVQASDIFYAQAWALIGYIESDPRRSQNFRDMLRADASGFPIGRTQRAAPPEDEFQRIASALDMSPDSLSAGYLSYIRRITASPD